MKSYNIKHNIGKSKYIVNYHDGIKQHTDKSPFFDIAIFQNKFKLAKFVTSLKNSGFIEI